MLCGGSKAKRIQTPSVKKKDYAPCVWNQGKADNGSHWLHLSFCLPCLESGQCPDGWDLSDLSDVADGCPARGARFVSDLIALPPAALYFVRDAGA